MGGTVAMTTQMMPSCQNVMMVGGKVEERGPPIGAECFLKQSADDTEIICDLNSVETTGFEGDRRNFLWLFQKQKGFDTLGILSWDNTVFDIRYLYQSEPVFN